jgi:2-haloalkanoic acid dehalogenase type II
MSSQLPWNEFRLLTFDCYGTLIDWEQGILGVLQPWAWKNHLAASAEELLRAFAIAESELQREKPQTMYGDILRESMARIAASFGSAAGAREQEALAASVHAWPVFSDTGEALRVLQNWHKLMVVSNVDRASFARTAPKLVVTLDGVVTAEEVGAYKPDKRMFERAFAVAGHWGIQPHQILHVAQSLYHDLRPAKALGLSTVWVDRRGGKAGGATPESSADFSPDLRVTSLGALAEIARAERRA